jgi:hypothetical protein
MSVSAGDRIGQKHVVRALNFALKNTVALRVRAALEERMTVSWLRSQASRGARVQAHAPGVYDITWPDGCESSAVSFRRAAVEDPGKTLVTIEDPRVRGLTTRIPPYIPELPVAQLIVPGVSDKVSGLWSLWRVGLSTFDGREQHVLPIFVTPEGHVLGPTSWRRDFAQREYGLPDLSPLLLVAITRATEEGTP